MSRPPLLHRPRKSTVIIGAIWVMTFALYIGVRPDPRPQTEFVPAVRVPVTEAPATTAPPPPPEEAPPESTEPPPSVPESTVPSEPSTTTTEPPDDGGGSTTTRPRSSASTTTIAPGPD